MKISSQGSHWNIYSDILMLQSVMPNDRLDYGGLPDLNSFRERKEFMNNDPTPELFAILDESHLTGGHLLQSQKGMTQIVTQIRNDIVNKTTSYIKRREDALKKELLNG